MDVVQSFEVPFTGYCREGQSETWDFSVGAITHPRSACVGVWLALAEIDDT